MIQADMHMHTWFSTDSEACPRDMADEAVRKGLKTICFTDHFDKDDLEWGEEGIFDVDAYFVEMQKLQEEYAGKLNIRIGIELGLRTYLKDYYEELTKKYPFDFVIGSVHNVPYKKDAEGNILYTDPAAEKLFTDRTDKKAYRLMMETTLENENFGLLSDTWSSGLCCKIWKIKGKRIFVYRLCGYYRRDFETID